MIMDWKVLTSKEVRELHAVLNRQFGFAGKLDYAFLKNNKGNLFMVTRDVSLIDWKKLAINSMGLYFGELRQGIRLSIEGSQLVGPAASKNVVELSAEEAVLWLKGNDVSTTSACQGYVIVKHSKDFLGCGTIKNGQILNFVPKIRRLPENA